MADDATCRIGDERELRSMFDEVSPTARIKVISALDAHCRNFIGLSPFLVIGSAAADGKADVSPRGDPPGFVHVLDDRTLAIPDRPGNNRIDTLGNIVANPEVALIFFVPGVGETLRVNGRAQLTQDRALLAGMAVNGKVPKLAIVVAVREAYLHCAKALKRSKLWEPESRAPKGAVPSIGRIIADQVGKPEMAGAIDERSIAAYRDKLY
jgi:PPOX class probable FMN-dependent enzyme